jgi:ppGpp synthetase/RelA/SpoT-type nucleotidyltranferase
VPARLRTADRQLIEHVVMAFNAKRHVAELAAQQLSTALRESQELAPFIHFMKYRVKDPAHLRIKLERKALERRDNAKAPNINSTNLFTKVGDLAGVRILHLHTDQIRPMVAIINGILDEHRYTTREGPTAIVWDREYAALYQEYGIKPETRDSMYTSVHYVVQPSQKTPIRIELQVRTLMEEVWGEVSHRVNYPEPSERRACIDQLKVLARMTSGCTRLVDSIFKSNAE